MDTETLYAQLAMAIDCEGTIGIHKQKDTRRVGGYRYYIGVYIYNTDYRLMQWCKQFGFKVYTRGKKQKPNHKEEHMAYITRHKAAAEVLEWVLPYLMLKQEQAEICLALQYTMRAPFKVVPLGVRTFRESLYQECKALNRKGVNSD